MKNILIAEPQITKEDWRAVKKVLLSKKFAQGYEVEQFENEFALFTGTKYAVALSSGTAALYLALLALEIGTNDEVITTPFSFIASSNAIVYTGAKPVFVDIGPDFNIDTKKIESKISRKTKMILPVHLYGLPSAMGDIKTLAEQYNLEVVEDCAQAHGAMINNQKVGTFGDLAAFSFYPTKNMTTIEGGMVTTNSKEHSNIIKMLRNHGAKERYHHDILGYNFRMNDIQAALGRSQLKKLTDYNLKRQQNARLYRKYLANIEQITLPLEYSTSTHVYHQFTIRTTQRELLRKKLTQFGIQTEIYYPIPIHQQKVFQKKGYNVKLPITEQISKEVLSLPVHPGLGEKEISYIAKKIKEILN